MISSGSSRPDSKPAATSMSSGTMPSPATGSVTKSSPGEHRRAAVEVGDAAPRSSRRSAARSSSDFSVEVNERRPTAARFGRRRLLLRRDPRCDSAARLGSGGVPTSGLPSSGFEMW